MSEIIETKELTINKDQPCLLLIDGSNFLFRAYHALPPLTNSKGQATGAIHGCITMFEKLIKRFNPKYVGVTFDSPTKSFRNDLYPDYKAHRKDTPDDLISQIAPLKKIISLQGLPLLEIEGIEADDVIATLAIQAKKMGYFVIIASSDKDLAQLVGEGIILYDGMKDQLIDREGVFNKYGVYPELIKDYLSLMGDNADNIPGINGVGPKTAAKWLNEYGSLDNLITNAQAIKGKIGEKLRQEISILSLSKQLVTLITDAKLEAIQEDLQNLIPKVADQNALLTIYQELEFKQLLNKLAKSTDQLPFTIKNQPTLLKQEIKNTQNGWVKPNPPAIKDYQVILTQSQLDHCINHLKQSTLLALDIETNGLNYMDSQMVGISFSVASGEAFYIPVALPQKQLELNQDLLSSPNHHYLAIEKVISSLKPILEDPSFPKVGQNIKFDWHIFKNHGLNLEGIVHDTMLMSYVLSSTLHRHNMEALALNYLDQPTISFEEIAGKGTKQLTFDQISLEKASEYACEDADITLRLSRALLPRLEDQPELLKLYQTIEIPILKVLAEMEHQGILLDKQYLFTLNQEFNARILELEKEAYALAGQVFNLASSKQLAEILFEKMQLPVIKKTPKGIPSTSEEVLEILSQDYELPKILMAHRELSKLNSTYTLSLIEQVSTRTGRVHTAYNQALTSTGRLSSSSPNLQNIPIKTTEGRRIRQAFIAKEGYSLISADYSQIELRLMAHFSKDPSLVNAFTNKEDIHKTTASQIFEVDINHVTDEQRRFAKTINFGLIYGMSAFGLSKQLNIGRKEAQSYIDQYFNRFSGVLDYMESAKESAKNNEYVNTLLGRKVYLPEINQSVSHVKKGIERLAVNAPIQGTAADIIKIAMIEVYQLLENSKLDAKLLLQVHDELVLEVKEGDVNQIKSLLHKGMIEKVKKILPLDVPLEIEIGVGKNWNDAH